MSPAISTTPLMMMGIKLPSLMVTSRPRRLKLLDSFIKLMVVIIKLITPASVRITPNVFFMILAI